MEFVVLFFECVFYLITFLFFWSYCKSTPSKTRFIFFVVLLNLINFVDTPKYPKRDGFLDFMFTVMGIFFITLLSEIVH